MIFKRILKTAALALLANIAVMFSLFTIPVGFKILSTLVLVAHFVYFNYKPGNDKAPTRKLSILINGYELLTAGHILTYLAVIINIFAFTRVSVVTLIVNILINIVVLAALLINGYIRIVTTSREVSISLKIALLFLWWMPIVNTIIVSKYCRLSKDEYEFAVTKHKLNAARKDQKIAQTKYPILLVHGIFFRDWQAFNYWGRIPDELIANGASIYYGLQQSSSSVEQSAQELKARINAILAETNSDKVNIIAHSKGGIDARYAISCLGMGGKVASLTTINSPHQGSILASKAIEVIPDTFVLSLGKKYDRMFAKLGDKQPDFFGGIHELTVEKSKALNELMPDHPDVYYQSVGSKMTNAASAPFPLNVAYSVIKAQGDDNDGLVGTRSMEWGSFLGVIETEGRQGVSHGDVIDLQRKNIKGFDVCEYYVQLVNKLKERGY